VAIDVGQTYAYSVTATGGTGTLSYTWRTTGLTVVSGCTSASTTCKVSGSGASYTVSVLVGDQSQGTGNVYPSSSSALTVRAAPTIPSALTANAAIDVGQTYTYSVTATGGTGTLSYTWTTTGLTVVSGCTPTSTSCTVNGSVASYTVSVLVGDQSQGTGNVYPSSSSALTVHTALTAPVAPSASATSLNANQGLTVTGLIPSTGTPTYAWQWLVSVNGGAYAPATQCAVNGGTGAVGGTTETCSIAANTLTTGDTYAFELQVTDSATSPSIQTSSTTSAVTVTSPSSSSSWPWIYTAAIIIGVLVLAIIVSAAVLTRRRRPHAAPPMQAWQEEPAPPTGVGPSSPTAAYLETPEDIGQVSREGIPAGVGGAAAAVNVPAAGSAEPDIDALMAELDRISGEILKNPSKKGAKGKGGEPTGEDDQTA
jgi:hypothetical protein